MIGNAIKFADNGIVEISARTAGEWIEISVTDTGVGIESHMRERIFMDYEQGSYEGSSPLGGTGLGLSITKRLVELHGGHISVDSVMGQGSTFTFTMPAATGSQESSRGGPPLQIWDSELPNVMLHPEYPSRIEGSKQEPILVVDDDSANVQSMINLFKLEGHTIIIANRGELALEVLASPEDIALVVLDITMPDLTGLEVLRR
ncbi:ATP-binding protein, partial [Mycobacterium tuberculosis]